MNCSFDGVSDQRVCLLDRFEFFRVSSYVGVVGPRELSKGILDVAVGGS